MSHESWQTAILAALTVVLLFQTIVLVGVALSVLKIRRPLEALIASTHELVRIARRRVERLDITLERIGQMIQERGEQADHVARELLEKSQIRAHAADELISHLLRKIERVSDEVEHIGLAPGHLAIHVVHAKH
jgi:hypothetical protein